MVASINTVSFQGIDVHPVDVQVQIYGLPAFTIVGYIRSIAIALFLLFASYTNAHADEIHKVGQMTCDEENNRALFRFNVVYSLTDFPRVNLPENLKEFDYLNDERAVKECQFKDGRKISFSYNTGQSFAYGLCGGDPSAYFSLFIDEQPVFYKKEWNAGRCNYGLYPLALTLNNQELISCIGPEDRTRTDFNKYKLNETDCENVSERLKSELSDTEKRRLERDLTISEYTEISLDHGLCQHFKDQNNIDEITWKQRDVKFEYLDNTFFPYKIATRNLDINNNNKEKVLYRFFSYDGYFDGSFFVYFDNNSEEKSFLSCLKDKQCPESLNDDNKNDIDFLESHIKDFWPNAHVISSNSLGENAKEYRVRYTWIYPFEYKQKNYLYFRPINKSLHPAAFIAKVLEGGAIETVCNYKEGSINGR